MKKNKFFNWFKGIKRDKKKEEKKKTIIVREQNNNNDEVFIEVPPIIPFPYVKDNNKEKETKKDENKILQDKDNKEKEYIIIEQPNIIPNEEIIVTDIPEVNKNKDDEPISDSFNYINPEEVFDNANKSDETEINLKNSIIREIEQMLKDEHFKIEQIKYELDILKDKENDNLSLQQANELEKELNDLIIKFEQIKKQFYNTNYDKLNTFGINDTYINSLIEEYKIAIKDKNIKNVGLLQIKKIENYISLIDDIGIIEENTNKLNSSLKNKKDNLKDANEKINKFENEANLVEKTNNYIDSFCKEQDAIINDLKHKIANNITITKTVESKTELSVNYSRLLTATLLMASTSIIPPTKNGNLLKTGLIVASIANLTRVANLSSKEDKTKTKIDYKDYEQNILSSMDNINHLDSVINKSINNIRILKEDFTNEFAEYKELIPEYSSLLSKLDSLEQELIIKRKIAKKYEADLQTSLKNNVVKIKRLED